MGISGAIPWFITAELFGQESRPAAVSIAVLVNWIANFSIGIGFPLAQVSLFLGRERRRRGSHVCVVVVIVVEAPPPWWMTGALAFTLTKRTFLHFPSIENADRRKRWFIQNVTPVSVTETVLVSSFQKNKQDTANLFFAKREEKELMLFSWQKRFILEKQLWLFSERPGQLQLRAVCGFPDGVLAVHVLQSSGDEKQDDWRDYSAVQGWEQQF